MLNQATVEKFHQYVTEQFTAEETTQLEKLTNVCRQLDPELQVLMTYDSNVCRAAIELLECHDNFGKGQLPEADWHRVVDVCRVLVAAISTEGWLEGYQHCAIHHSDTVH